MFSLDGKTLQTSTDNTKKRWTEHFTQLLGETSTVSDSVINSLPQRPEETCLDEIPTIHEVEKAISQIKDKKSAGPDGIQPELFTHGGQTVATHLHRLFVEIWIDAMIPADMRNANIITIFKKNDRHNVNNYRGIYKSFERNLCYGIKYGLTIVNQKADWLLTSCVVLDVNITHK